MGYSLTGVSSGHGVATGQDPLPEVGWEFQAWFRTDADCMDYLDWLRWPGGHLPVLREWRGLAARRWPV